MSPAIDTKEVVKQLFRIKEAAVYLNLHPEVVRRMIVSGELKAIRRKGKHTPWLVSKQELDRWIEKHSVTGPGGRRS